MPAVKADKASVAGDFCSHIGTVSQAPPAVMLQVARRHMRTTPIKLIGIMKGVRYYFEVLRRCFREYIFGATMYGDRSPLSSTTET